jgi:hypothetical protein
MASLCELKYIRCFFTVLFIWSMKDTMLELGNKLHLQSVLDMFIRYIHLFHGIFSFKSQERLLQSRGWLNYDQYFLFFLLILNDYNSKGDFDSSLLYEICINYTTQPATVCLPDCCPIIIIV